MPHVACIALGSNLGDRAAAIRAAVEILRADPGVHEIRLSSLHETEPVGGPPGQGRYLNAAARIETSHDAASLLGLLLATEVSLGRRRGPRWGPRTIDLDLLLFDDQAIDQPGLVVPHPRMHQRSFVLAPLAEIAPDARHPLLEKTVREFLRDLAPRSPSTIPPPQ